MALSPEYPSIIVQGTGGGSTGPWSLAVDGTPWTWESASHIKVTYFETVDAETGTVFTEGVDYSLGGVSGAGSVTLTIAITDAERLLIERVSPDEQLLTFGDSPNLNTSNIEEAHDRTVRSVQEIDARLDWLLGPAGYGQQLTPAFATQNEQGPVGDKGDKGDKGDTGDRGPVGDKGSVGDQGPSGGTDGVDGDSAYQVWLDEGNTGTEQDFLDSLQGEKGDKGDTGDAGAAGAPGAQGPPGEDGADATLSLASGAGYRENTDNKVTQWGVAIISSSAAVAVTLPIALTNTDYRLAVTGIGELHNVSMFAKTTTTFQVKSDGEYPDIVDWILEGGEL